MVGTVFFAMNQLGIIVEGRATTAVWIKAALTYVTPLRVSNFGILSATRRPHLSSPGHRRGDEMKIKMTTNPSTS
jgi:hypothetical protein